MIKFIINQTFKRPEFTVIAHKTAGIKVCAFKLDLDDIVMAMQARTGVIGFQSCQLVAGGKGELFGDGEHQSVFHGATGRVRAGWKSIGASPVKSRYFGNYSAALWDADAVSCAAS